jgi:hypothetical protein
VVRVGGELTRRPDAVRKLGGEEIGERSQSVGAPGEEPDAPVFEAGCMCEQVSERDRLGVGRWNLRRLEVGVQVRVEIELAFLVEPHHRGPGEELGDRAHPKQRALGIYRPLASMSAKP